DKLAVFYKALHAGHRILIGFKRAAVPAKSLLVGIVEQVAKRIAENISWGNDMVYEDIAPHYAAMFETFRSVTTYDQNALDRFNSRFRPGSLEDGGEDVLKAAFTSYYQAIFERDAKRKAELVLLGNNRIGYHEQSRLQQAIIGSLNAPIADLIAKTTHARARELTHRSVHGAIDRVIDRILEPLSGWMQQEWQGIATSWFMHLQLPDTDIRDKIVSGRNNIRVGHDALPRCEHRDFPVELTKLDNIELKALLYDLDRSPDRLDDSAAENWCNLGDRMNYLVDLFRTRQQDQRLFRQPFTDQQISSLRDGKVPDGPL
ncbi:MAG: hypothetical protein AAGC55_29090, partial [Myxococcota bacterium]